MMKKPMRRIKVLLCFVEYDVANILTNTASFKLKKRIEIFFLILLCSCSAAEASFERSLQPAIVVGRGISGIALLEPEWYSLNPANQSGIKKFKSSLFYSPSQFELSQLNGSGVLLGQHCNFGNVGFAITTFGFSLYRETIGTINYSTTIEKDFSYGMNFNINHLSIERYGSTVILGIDVGMSLHVAENFRIACSLLNSNRPHLKDGEELPQQFIVGASYFLFDITTLTVDAVKDIRYPLSLRTGIEVSPHRIFRIRAGVLDAPSRLSGGISVVYSSLRFDYGIMSHQELGASHSIGISFEID